MRIFKSAAEKAEEHFEKGRFNKAAELFAKAEQWQRVAEIREHHLDDLRGAAEAWDRAEKPIEAGRVLELAGDPRAAVGYYQKAGTLKRAAEASLAAKDPERAAIFYEQAELFERAAQCFLDVGSTDRALRALEREREDLERRRDGRADPHLDDLLRVLDLRRATILERSDRFLEAARLYREQGEIAESARLFEKAGAADRAARAYLDTDHHAEALRLAESSEVIEPELHAEILLHASKPQQAAELFATIGKHDAAALAYEEAGQLGEAAEQWRREHRYRKAAELFERAERPYDAAQCWAQALGDYDARAGENFERAGATSKAGDAFLSAGDNLRAGRLYREAGQADDARRVLAEIRPADAGYFDAAFELVPLYLDIREGAAAGQQLKAIKDSGRRFPAHQVDYCHGRIFEFRRRYTEAEAAYQRVLAEHPEYRDTADRLDRVRSLLDDPNLIDEDDGPETGITQVLQADAHVTRRMLKTSSADTGAMPDRVSALETFQADSGWEELSGAIATLAEADMEESSELPVELGDRLDHPWWDGADFFEVRDKETRERRYMVSFPLAFVGDRVQGFQTAIRQISALQQRAILELKGMQRASDKVLLFYDHLDAMPLATILQDSNRGFTPRGALHLLVQLCDALSSAHKLGVTHQWLSPKTILVDRQNRCKIVGLGLREFLAGQDSTSRAYQSPEVQNDGVIGPTCDVYSLGLLAMELLEVQMPVQASLDPDDYHWPRVVEDEVPAPLRNFLVRCLEPNPVQRPSTAEMAAALASIGLLSGQVLGNRYEVQGEIGRGGMSRVYRAWDPVLETDVAIKTVLTAALGRSEDEDRLVREVKISLRISHPNVVRVHDMGRFPGGIFMIMELLDGPGLDQVISTEAPLELDRIRRLVHEIASALGEAHRLNIVHRDLKPGNVILVDDRAKVLDFGIARNVDGNSPHLTRTGEVIGSPLYMSPEQVQGKPLDGTSDLYSLGVITFALLTGKEPFAADNATEVVLKHLHEPPPNAASLRPGGLADPWLDLLDRLLRKDPTERPADAATLIRWLDALPT